VISDNLKSSFLVLPAILFLISVSLYLSPGAHDGDIELAYKNYYSYYAEQYKEGEENNFEEEISTYIERILIIEPNGPLPSYMFVGMFSGNENISIISGIVHFSYLIRSEESTESLLIIASLLYASLFLAGMMSITHNLLTYIFRLHIIPTKAYLAYVPSHFKDLNADERGEVSFSGYVRALTLFFPGWLIGYSIGFSRGEFDQYFEPQLVDIELFVAMHLYCACANGILILFIHQAIKFSLMKLNIDIMRSHIDELLCAGIGVFVSYNIFGNGIGTTIAVTLGTVLYTIGVGRMVRST